MKTNSFQLRRITYPTVHAQPNGAGICRRRRFTRGGLLVTDTACQVLLCVLLRNYNLFRKDYTVPCLISELIYDF